MTLASRVVALLLLVLVAALAGSLVLHTWSARMALEQQLQVRNREGASALAVALSQHQGDLGAMEMLAQAHFDMGGYTRLRMTGPDGNTVLIHLQRQAGTPTVAAASAASAPSLTLEPSRTSPTSPTSPTLLAPPSPPPSQTPAWFVQALPLRAQPGQAQVSSGWKQLGSVQVWAPTAWAHDALWQALSRTAALLVALGLGAAAAAVFALRAWRRPLQATVAQAQALEAGRFVQAPEPRLPELRELTRSMNAMVARMRQVLTQRAQELEALQRAAQHDALTGLLLRKDFLARLGALRSGATGGAVTGAVTGIDTGAVVGAVIGTGADVEPSPSGPAVVLLMLRMHELHALNAAHGHAQTDVLLQALAQPLLAYVGRVDGSFAGRLNGSDFALCLPVAGLAEETAHSLHAALAQAPALKAAGAAVWVGGVEMHVGMPLASALALADAALAQAEGGAGWAVLPGSGAAALGAEPAASAAHASSLVRPLLTQGAQAWRQHIASALAEHRTELATYAVVGPQGQVLTLQCPLRVQLGAGQPYQAAAQWLALARRSRLMPQLDMRALELALAACAQDQQARTVHMAWPSLRAAGFADGVTRRLQQAPGAAQRLSMVWTHAVFVPGGPQDGQQDGQQDGLSAAPTLQAWRALGVRIGLEHRAGPAQRLVDFKAFGPDFVKVDASHFHGLGEDAAVHRYVVGLVRLIHTLEAQAWAAGVAHAHQLPALWACGFDAATGVGVSALQVPR